MEYKYKWRVRYVSFLTLKVNLFLNLNLTRGQFYQHSTCSFYLQRSWKHKKTVKLSVFLRFQDLHKQKLLVECWWNWHKDGLFRKAYCLIVKYCLFSYRLENKDFLGKGPDKNFTIYFPIMFKLAKKLELASMMNLTDKYSSTPFQVKSSYSVM